MRNILILVLGTFFGIVLSKGEIISWYRIYEMFRFESFHMYGVIGSAVVLGIIMIQIMKRTNMKTIDGNDPSWKPFQGGFARYLLGGTIFGLGWAMTGACPGPMFMLFGRGIMSFGLIIIFAVMGTFVYGILKPKLPH